MIVSKRFVFFAVSAVIMMVALAQPPQLSAETPTTGAPEVNKNRDTPQWSVQVNMVDPGNASISASFQIAIYESLLDELNKTKRFKQVLRDGERTSSDVPDLLILRTTVEKYAAGSETRRAVTTISGATKITVRSQLCKLDGQIIWERTVQGNVLFVGSNMRATRNLARNVAETIKRSAFPASSMSALAQTGQQPAQDIRARLLWVMDNLGVLPGRDC